MGDILKDKVAVVTGSGRGIGRAIIMAMAEQGAKVVVNDLGGEVNGTGVSRSPADDVVNDIREKGGVAVANYDSVVTPEGGENIIKTAVDNFGRLDILVNNAGVARDKMIFNMSEEDFDIVIKVHLYGSFHCTKPATVLMREQRGGRIINIASMAALGNMGQTNYGMAKAGLLGFTRCVARDMGRYGVTCNALIPTAPTRLGWNPDLEKAWAKRAEQGDPIAIKGLSLMRTATPEDNGPLAVFLASDATSNVNGCLFQVRIGEITLFTSEPTRRKTIVRDGRWPIEELMRFAPEALTNDVVNPVPPQQK